MEVLTRLDNGVHWFQFVGMPRPTAIDSLLERYPVISDQVDKGELRIILSELHSRLAITPHDASVVELGCYIGTTSLFIRRLLDIQAQQVAFHVYDSFVGLPEKTTKDLSPAGEQFRAGELAVSRKVFELQFKKANLRLPVIHKGWFSEIAAADVPDGICYAYLDGDYYESIRDSLCAIETNLLPDATIVVDDYANEALPGARRAVDEWLRGRAASLRVESSLAIIHLQNT